jgi:PAS domain S-box-containing protein
MGTKTRPHTLEQAFHQASNAHSVIAVTDAKGVITQINENFIRLSGYGRDELIGQTHAVVNSGYHSDGFFAKLWQHIASGKPWRGKIQNRAKNGDLYWVDTTIYPMLDAQGAISGYTSIRTDITTLVMEIDRRKQEAENAACLKALYDSSCKLPSIKDVLDSALNVLMNVSWLRLQNKGGIFLVDEQGKSLRLQASHNLGEISSRCSKVTFGHCLCGRAAQSKQTQFASCIDDRHEVRIEGMQPHGHYNVPMLVGEDLLGVLVIYLNHGAKRCSIQEAFLQNFCASLATIIRLKQKQIRLNDEVIRSTTLAKQAQKASEEAMQAAEAKANFLATMSHEIRTPMNSVLGMLYLMELSDLDEEQREYAAIGKSSADSLMHIIDDILDYSKYEQGSFTLEEIPHDLSDVIRDSLAPFKAPAEAKGVALEIDIDARLPDHIVGDPARFRQILTNLVSNALKFTDRGKIRVAVNALEHGQQPHLCLQVADTGTGITPEALDHIFERFSQADTSITRKYGGTGLGLAICKTLAGAMGGEIGVDTIVGEGSTFWVRLPVIAAQTALETSASDEGELAILPPDMPLNILVAEDNPHNQFLIRKILEANAHHVTCVDDGMKAVEMASQTTFDVILMDMQMPVLDGLSATREVRKLPAPYGDVPIYAVTANALEMHHEQSRAAGMNGHINKPIQPAELYGVLAQITQHKTDQDETLLYVTG